MTEQDHIQMRLRYRYELDTGANDDTGSLKDLVRHIDDCDVEFFFDNEHRLVAINVLIPKVKVTYNSEGKVEPLDKTNDQKAHITANYVVNILQEMTGKCDIRKMPDTPECVPETEEDKKELEAKTFTRTMTKNSNAFICGRCDFSEGTLNKYIKHVDAFAIYSDAKRMNNPVGKYREFFRVFECFFRFEEATSGKKKFSKYFTKSRYTKKDIRDIIGLRNQCSHAAEDYITSNDLAGIEKIRKKMQDIEKMAKLLLESPP
jgi:hypothetical protein